MAFCSKCGNQLIDGAKFCPKCGQPRKSSPTYSINVEKNSDYVIVHGYEETFAIDVNVSIYKDGIYLGEVSPASTFNVPIEGNCELKFKASFRSTKVQIIKGVHSHVFLSFDRFTGSLKAYVSRDDNKVEIEAIKQHKSSKATLWSIILIVTLFLLSFLFRFIL